MKAREILHKLDDRFAEAIVRTDIPQDNRLVVYVPTCAAPQRPSPASPAASAIVRPRMTSYIA